jgi:hypothetical protein
MAPPWKGHETLSRALLKKLFEKKFPTSSSMKSQNLQKLFMRIVIGFQLAVLVAEWINTEAK